MRDVLSTRWMSLAFEEILLENLIADVWASQKQDLTRPDKDAGGTDGKRYGSPEKETGDKV